MAEIKIDLAEMFDEELDIDCWQCHGDPLFYGYRKNPIMSDKTQEKVCGICEGKGRQLTEAGEKLLEFIKRWA